MDHLVILNGGAGTSADSPPVDLAIRDAFAAAGATAEVRQVAPAELEAALRRALEGKVRRIVVGGGDGSVRSAAAVLAGTDFTLGVLPLGTLNHFAKDLGMPSELTAAVAALVHGVEDRVDVGEVNGNVFINNCSVGSYAETVRRRDAIRATRHHGKWRAMLLATLQTLRRLHLLRLQLSIDDAPVRAVRTPLVVVGNNRYSGHVLERSLRDRLDAGQLWLYTVHVHRRLAVIRLMLQALMHGLDGVDDLESEPAQALVIRGANRDVPVALDGEPMQLGGDLRFRVRARALRVIRPAPESRA